MSAGSWETPLGAVSIDAGAADDLKRRFSLLSEDSEAHRLEHANEVELPFLQVLRAEFTFVPIAIGTGQLSVLEGLGTAIAETIRSLGEPVLIVASSDMNHYESDAVTRVKDHKAIEQILGLNGGGIMYETVQRRRRSVCAATGPPPLSAYGIEISGSEVGGIGGGTQPREMFQEIATEWWGTRGL